MKQKTTLLKLAFMVTALFIAGSNLKAQTLVAHYKFDNSITDETGTWNLTATDEDSSIIYEMGQDGTANGAITGFDRGDFLSTVTNFSISGDVSRTMTAWVKLIAATPQTAVVGGGINANGEKWTFGHQGSSIRTEVSGKGANRGTLELDKWHHIATVWDKDADLVSMYLDGVLAGTAVATWAINTAEAPLLVGNDFNADPKNRGFNGAIDDVQIYTGAGDAAFIKAIYDTTILSNESINSESFSVYPNPTTDRLNITLSSVVSVDIYNISGAKIGHQSIDGSVDMSNLATGVYVIKCNNAAGNSIATVRAVKN